MKRLAAFWSGMVIACSAIGGAYAQEVPAYRAEHSVTGTIRIWGPPSMSAVTKYWAEGFQKFHPGARIETTLKGSATAMPGLYSGRADIALLGRENNLTDDNGFGRVKQYKPLRIALMGGSLDVPGKADALVVFVHKDNPLERLSLDQLDAIFGYEHRRGLASIRTWGELGVMGEWSEQPIRLHAYDAQTGTGDFFRRVVLGGSHKMNWDRLIEYKDARRADGTIRKAAEQSIEAMRDDRYAMAISSLRHANDTIKPLALANTTAGPYHFATRQTLIARSYPLARPTYAFVDHAPGSAFDPNLREFLRYALSREGQADVLRDRGYLPLSAEALAQGVKTLDETNRVGKVGAR
jgi:phosphate transport system substrate-binding protein